MRIVTLTIAAVLITACSPKDVSQVTETVERADSLLTTTRSSIRKIDSFAKKWNDSSNIPPALRKTADEVQRMVKNRHINKDSISAVLNRSARMLENDAEAMQMIDSAKSALENSDNPLEAVAALGKTVDKIAKRSPEPAQAQQDPLLAPEEDAAYGQDPYAIPDDPMMQNSDPMAQSFPDPGIISGVPLKKSAELTMDVNDLEAAADVVQNMVKKYHGSISTENFEREGSEGRQTYHITIPNENFEAAVDELSMISASMTRKNIRMEGSVGGPEQEATIDLTLVQDLAATGVVNPKESLAKKIFRDSLPFLPILLILGLFWFFIQRRRKKRAAEQLRNMTIPPETRPEPQPTVHVDTAAPVTVTAESSQPAQPTSTKQTTRLEEAWASIKETESPDTGSGEPSVNENQPPKIEPTTPPEDEDPYAKYKPKF